MKNLIVVLFAFLMTGVNAQNMTLKMSELEERESLRRVLVEFNALKNDQAFSHILKRIMEPVPGRQAEFFGCDQRIDLLPSLSKLVKILPQNAQIFDVGAGSGDVVDFALKDISHQAIINIEEPNYLLREEYSKKLKKHPQLKQGAVCERDLQDYYQKEGKCPIPKQSQNLILAIHMIYHLTDFTAPTVDPEKDIIDAVSFLYELLAPGGAIFLVYAANPEGMAIENLAERYFRYACPDKSYADNLHLIYGARNKLLGPYGSIANELFKRFPQTKPKLKSELRECYFFGQSVADVAAIALAGELCPSDNKPFELTKLQFCWDELVQHPQNYGLQKEERNVPQKGFWRAKEPQVIAIITKEPL